MDVERFDYILKDREHINIILFDKIVSLRMK